MKIVKIINKDKKFTAKNGKEYNSVNYYIQLDNMKLVAIRPSFKNGYFYLDSIAEVINNEVINNDDMPF